MKEVIRNNEFCRGREKDRKQTLALRFYDFECTQNTLDAETDRLVHKVNYSDAMSACDKCTDDHPCEDCSQTQIFSGLKGRDALKDFCMWAFDDKINQEAVFIAHNGSNYDSHFILSYLVENTEYPEILVNGGKMLQMYIKTCESKFIDSCCFLSMPLNKFSDTFNLPDVVKGTFPSLLQHTKQFRIRLACYQLYTITNPTVLKNPLVLNSSSGTMSTQMTSLFLTARFTNTVRLTWLC